jgi:hypothetical protein
MEVLRLQNEELRGKKKINIFDEMENWTGDMDSSGDSAASRMATTAFGRKGGLGAKAGTTLMRAGYGGTVMLSKKKGAGSSFVIEKELSFVATERSL